MEVFNIHKVLRSLLHDRISISFDNLSDRMVNYGEGDLKELVKFLSAKKQKYPILWLSSEFEHETPTRIGSKKRVSSSLTFFVITKGSAHDFYFKRYEGRYEFVVYPVISAFLELMENQRGVNVYDKSIKIADYPYNHSNSFEGKKEKMTINDIWDATKFTIELEFVVDCFRELNHCKKKNYRIWQK